MQKEVDVTKANLNIIFEVDGELYAVAMDKSNLDAMSFLVKRAVSTIVPLNKTQEELEEFLGIVREER